MSKLILLAVFLLAGCGDHLQRHEIDAAIDGCKSHGGVVEIKWWFLSPAVVVCVDGTRVGNLWKGTAK